MYASTLEGPVVVIGSAHVVDLEAPLRATLNARPLDAVALELDEERARAVLVPSGEARPSRSGGPFFARLWMVIQRRLGEQIGGGPPGAEMRIAAEVARERGVPVFLIDDSLRETLPRLLRALSVRERVSLLVGSIIGLVVPTRVVERQLDRYTDAPADVLGELRDAYPGITRVLLDERNEHMADRLVRLRSQGFGHVAAVVGDAHVAGLSGALRRRGIPVDAIPLSDLRGPRGPSAATSRLAPPT